MTAIDHTRNLYPHAEARMAMALWGYEYSQQNGGSMDFWDGLTDSRKTLCAALVTAILEANASNGRAALEAQERTA